MIHALAEKDERPQVEHLAESGAGAAADHHRLDLGQIAFLIIGESQIKLLACHQAEYGVAQKLHAFVGGQARVGSGGVSQRGAEQLRLAKLITDCFLALIQNFGFVIEA